MITALVYRDKIVSQYSIQIPYPEVMHNKRSFKVRLLFNSKGYLSKF